LSVFFWAGVVLVFLLLPSIYLFMWSVMGTGTVGILGHPTSRWFVQIVRDPGWWKSFGYSIVLALLSSTLSLVSCLLYFYFSIWRKRAYQAVGYGLLVGPLVLPTVVYALALRIAFSSHGSPEYLPLVLGHIALLYPVQYFILESGNELLKTEWIYASATLGASHSETITRVLWPVLRTPISLAFGIGLLFSFDEVVVAVFVIDSATATVPKKMWDSINRQMDPTPAVIATLLFLLTVMTVILAWLNTRRRRGPEA